MEITPTIYDDLWFGRIHPPRTRYAICYYRNTRPDSVKFSPQIPLYYCKKQEYSDPVIILYEAGETKVTGRTNPGSIVGTLRQPLGESLVAMSPLR